jgi:hypothetical protein
MTKILVTVTSILVTRDNRVDDVDTQQKEATITYDNVIDMSGKVPTRSRAFEQDAVEQRTMAYQLQGEDVGDISDGGRESDACMSNGWSDRETRCAGDVHLARGSCAAGGSPENSISIGVAGSLILEVWRNVHE